MMIWKIMSLHCNYLCVKRRTHFCFGSHWDAKNNAPDILFAIIIYYYYHYYSDTNTRYYSRTWKVILGLNIVIANRYTIQIQEFID